MKKLWRFLSSMRFAIALLALLALACALSSTVTQGQSFAWYSARYGERVAALILALGLDDAFHSWWFLLLCGFLSLNLTLCSLKTAPALIRRSRRFAQPPEGGAGVERRGVADPAPLFSALGMGSPRSGVTGEGRELLYAHRNRLGLWGAWICHLGILLLILGFGLGQSTRQEYVVYGVPGQLKQVGDTELMLAIRDFRINLREDDTVSQYAADITVYDMSRAGDPGESASISVNHPATLKGLRFYQNSTGWAATVTVLKAGEPLQQEILCAGEYLPVKDRPELVVYFNAFYPDYVLVPGQGPASRSGQLLNPGYLYSLYYQGELLGMNVLMGEDVITVGDYTVRFSQPQSYTLIQAKRDAFTPLALLGGLVTTLGLFLAFYLPPCRVWAVQEEEGWRVCGDSPKGGVLFEERFLRALEGAEKGVDTHAAS